MSENALKRIQEFGQSVWLDNLDQSLIEDGTLQDMVERDGLRGVTSNPSIFKKAIADTETYQERIATLARDGASAREIYTRLTVADIQGAAGVLRPVYDASDGAHGFVSLEVDPHLARDQAGTEAEARRLWAQVDRPNVMIKVPATAEGLPAIRNLIAEGINVNVTLLFGLPRYREVARAYLDGLQDRVERDEPLEGIASVASFFLSRIDTLVDRKLDELPDRAGQDDRRIAMAGNLRGQTAIACARQAYRMFGEFFSPAGFGELAVRGARPQRLLWASTSTKDPSYDDIRYVEPLIGPETVNTMPDKTLAAYRDHGQPADRLTGTAESSARTLVDLTRLGVDLEAVSRTLEEEGIRKFQEPYDRLLEVLEQRRIAAVGGKAGKGKA
jgi:transaldolase